MKYFVIIVIRACVLITFLSFLSACAAQHINAQPKTDDVSYKNLNFPDGTLVIGVIAGCLSIKEIINGCYAEYMVYFPPLKQELLSKGFVDGDIKNCSVAVIEHSAHWHSTRAGYDGKYGVKWAIADKDLLPSLIGGEIVEIVVTGGIGKIIKIRHRSDEKNFCKMEKYKKNLVAETIDALNPVGGPGSVSLACSDVDYNEWKKYNYGLYGEFMIVKTPSN